MALHSMLVDIDIYPALCILYPVLYICTHIRYNSSVISGANSPAVDIHTGTYRTMELESSELTAESTDFSFNNAAASKTINPPILCMSKFYKEN